MFAFAPLSGLAKEIFQPDGVITKLAKDESFKDKVIDKITPSFPSLSEWLGVKEKVKEIAEQMHQQALLTPDPLDDKIDFLEYMRHYVDSGVVSRFMPNWFKDFMIFTMAMFNQITHNSVQFVFTHIYKFVTEVVLYTPEWIFGNDWFPAAVSNYSILSVGCIMVFAMIEGIKRMLNMSHTKFSDTLKKLPLALGVSASTPFLFSTGLKTLNKFTKLIIELSSDTMITHNASIFAISLAFEPINVLMMLAFLIITVVLCVPMVLLHARRWFNLMMLGLLTPLAMGASLFDATHGYYQMWLRSIKNSAIAQLGYAVFVSILGLLMFGTPNPTTVTGVFSKSLLLLGGIHCMAFPPNFIRRFDDNGSGFYKMSKQLKEYSEKQIDSVKGFREIGENALVKGAYIAGKGYRFLFKK